MRKLFILGLLCGIKYNGEAFYLPTPLKTKSSIKTNKLTKFIPEKYEETKALNILTTQRSSKTTSLQMAQPPFDLETITPIIINFVMLFSIYSLLSFIIWRFSSGNNLPGMFNKKKEVDAETINVKFEDVAGCDYVKTEVEDIIEYLRNPDKFKNLGAKVPRGILLNGPPGTGKTLLAKAIAGEAKVPFFASDGSSFIQMYVGVGSMRIRELFDKARKSAPAIVFIDEIDAIGGKRGMNINGGNDERDQTLNQLLIEMDGFSSNLHGESEAVIVVASTNRIDILDEALLRAGRFDRKIYVKKPDSKGRREILKVHSKGKPLSDDIDFDAVVAQTTGYTGADLATIMNEAAILAMRQNATIINNEHVSEALDKTLIGISLKDKVNPEIVDDIVSIHEAGHALVALLLNHNTVTRISIIASSNGAGGFTLLSPDENTLDVGLVSKTYILNELKVLLGGRIAEEIIFGKDLVTTGASNDLARAKQLVEQYLVDFCMEDEQLFGYDFEKNIPLVLQEYYKKTYDLLNENKHLLEIFSKALKEKKILYKDEIYKLFNDNKLVIDTNLV